MIFSDHEMMKNSVMKIFRDYRYFISLLGFFSFFIGFVYNDMMSIPLQLCSSCYETYANSKKSPLLLPPASVISKSNCVYPFGFDYKWF